MERTRLLELAGVDTKSGFTIQMEKDTENNKLYRKVVYTAAHMQLVLMCVKPGQEIGMETHKGDQFIRVESGTGKAIMGGVESSLEDGDAIIIPEGVEHNVINTSDNDDLKLYAVYTPPEHKDGHIDQEKPG